MNRTRDDFIADMAARFVERTDGTTEKEARRYASEVFHGIDDSELDELERDGWTKAAAEEWADADMSYWEHD